VRVRPARKRRDASQAWFWTRKWRRREREADQDLRAGRVERYDSDEEFLESLGSSAAR